jgi:hypothetical protein
LVLSCFDDERPYTIYCEPEATEYLMRPGDALTVTFHGSKKSVIDVVPVEGGLIVWRPSDALEITAVDRHGNEVDVW